MNYTTDHRHCPPKDSPCGIEGEHRCCLCEKAMPDKVDQRVEFLIEYAEEIDRPEERYQLVKFELKQALTLTRAEAFDEALEWVEGVKINFTPRCEAEKQSLAYKADLINDWLLPVVKKKIREALQAKI